MDAAALSGGEAERLMRKVIEAALEGDMVALKLCLGRIVPPRKERPLPIELPSVGSALELPRLTGAILTAP